MEKISRLLISQLSHTVRRMTELWRAWKRKRLWTQAKQVEHLRTMLLSDHRWLAHDKTANALTERYLAALAPDWMSVVHTDAAHFRREIGLDPVNAFTKMTSAENLARLDRMARSEPAYSDGPLPERGGIA